MKYIFNFLCNIIAQSLILSTILSISILEISYLIWNFKLNKNKFLVKLFSLYIKIIDLPLKKNSIKYIHDKIIEKLLK